MFSFLSLVKRIEKVVNRCKCAILSFLVIFGVINVYHVKTYKKIKLIFLEVEFLEIKNSFLLLPKSYYT